MVAAGAVEDLQECGVLDSELPCVNCRERKGLLGAVKGLLGGY